MLHHSLPLTLLGHGTRSSRFPLARDVTVAAILVPHASPSPTFFLRRTRLSSLALSSSLLFSPRKTTCIICCSLVAILFASLTYL